MYKNNTLENYWCATVRGYPIVVEEHLSDLTYIVEFYDGRELGNERCVTFLPDPDELLTVDLLQQKRMAAAVQ